VYLSAYNAEGSDINARENYITVYDTGAQFSGDPLVGEPPLTVQFTNSSTIRNISSWAWYDNGVLFSNAQDPAVSLPIGQHSIQLNIIGDITDWENKTNYIDVGYAPTAHFDMAVV
jgi:PKD repeat protein